MEIDDMRHIAKQFRKANTSMARGEDCIKVSVQTGQNIADALDTLAEATERDVSPNQLF